MDYQNELRKRFERWAFESSELEEGTECDPETGCYIDDQMELAWAAYQAGASARVTKQESGDCYDCGAKATHKRWWQDECPTDRGIEVRNGYEWVCDECNQPNGATALREICHRDRGEVLRDSGQEIESGSTKFRVRESGD